MEDENLDTQRAVDFEFERGAALQQKLAELKDGKPLGYPELEKILQEADSFGKNNPGNMEREKISAQVGQAIFDNIKLEGPNTKEAIEMWNADSDFRARSDASQYKPAELKCRAGLLAYEAGRNVEGFEGQAQRCLKGAQEHRWALQESTYDKVRNPVAVKLDKALELSSAQENYEMGASKAESAYRVYEILSQRPDTTLFEQGQWLARASKERNLAKEQGFERKLSSQVHKLLPLEQTGRRREDQLETMRTARKLSELKVGTSRAFRGHAYSAEYFACEALGGRYQERAKELRGLMSGMGQEHLPQKMFKIVHPETVQEAPTTQAAPPPAKPAQELGRFGRVLKIVEGFLKKGPSNDEVDMRK